MIFVVAVVMSNIVDLFFHKVWRSWCIVIELVVLFSLGYIIGALNDRLLPLDHWLLLYNVTLFAPLDWLIILVVFSGSLHVFLLYSVLCGLEVTLKIVVVPLRLLGVIVNILVVSITMWMIIVGVRVRVIVFMVVCSLIMMLYRHSWSRLIIPVKFLRPSIFYPVIFLEI